MSWFDWFDENAAPPALKRAAPRRIFSDEAVARHVRAMPVEPPPPVIGTVGEIAAGPRPITPTPFQQASLGTLMDWAATGYGLSTRSMTELNPLLQGLKDDPAKTVAALAAMDLAAVPLLKKLEAAHPRIARWVLPAIGAYRMGLAMNNLALVRTNRGRVQEGRRR